MALQNKKQKTTNQASDSLSDHVASCDILSHPNVMTMDKSKLKAELNRLLVHINGNPGKETLQAKLLTAYQDELLNRAGKHYHRYNNCFYRVIHTSKKKLCVTLGCTRYQVFAPGVVESPWTDYNLSTVG
jgi:hypothetical protein